MKIAQAGLMAALCYIGYAVFPAISASGTKIHIGNAFVVLSAYLLGIKVCMVHLIIPEC